MQDEQQFEQLMLQYKQLKTGAEDIRHMIENEDFDSAITMLQSRESIYLNCKCMQNFLELTPVQEKELNTIKEELKSMELANIRFLEEGMTKVQLELKTIQKTEKIQQAYDFEKEQAGSIINVTE